MVFLWFGGGVWLVAAPLPFLVHVFWAEPHGIQATRCQWHCAKLAFKVLKSINDYQCQQQFLQRLYLHRITANEIIWMNTGANLFLRGFNCPDSGFWCPKAVFVWTAPPPPPFVCSFVPLFVCSFVLLFCCSFVLLLCCSFVLLFFWSFVFLFCYSFVSLFFCSFVERNDPGRTRTCNLGLIRPSL